MMKQILCIATVVTTIFAAGPSKVAIIDRSLSPIPLGSVEQFNLSSRITLIAAAAALGSLPLQESDSAAALRLGIKKVNEQSIKRWRLSAMEQIMANYRAAVPLPPNSPTPTQLTTESIAAAQEAINKAYPQWSRALTEFFENYWFEQERLAAYWPSVTSEIFTFSDCNEQTGSSLSDRSFRLTFDDGPTPPNGSTDAIIAHLKTCHITATFFVLTSTLDAIKASYGEESLKNRYAGMSVGSHGQIHSSYQKKADAIESYNHSITALEEVFGAGPKLFRPPYGQRSESLAKVASQRAPVVLWNIDSQDWNTKLSAQQIADRTITLMVMHRRGIVLFHDIYAKSASALKVLTATINGIRWE
jgi:peptidoglycan/xylan/chitin deacetylase (PgdA/CDA1 family)